MTIIKPITPFSSTLDDARVILTKEQDLVQAVYRKVRDSIDIPVVKQIVAAIPAGFLMLMLSIVPLSLGLFVLFIDFARYYLPELEGERLTIDCKELEAVEDVEDDEPVSYSINGDGPVISEKLYANDTDDFDTYSECGE